MEIENYYVTHVIISEPPKQGFEQLFYYTTKNKTLEDGEFYWGRGHNSFNKEFIENLLSKNKIQKLNSAEYPLLINIDETLWIDESGIIYKSNIENPLLNQEKICVLEVLKGK